MTPEPPRLAAAAGHTAGERRPSPMPPGADPDGLSEDQPGYALHQEEKIRARRPAAPPTPRLDREGGRPAPGVGGGDGPPRRRK